MKRTIPRLEGKARAIAKDELIGRTTAIVVSTDPGLVGLSGRVVDETLRTFTLRLADGREVRVGKAESTFEIDGVHIPGLAMEFRPEDRTKKVK
ncbi:MAG TPA: ribonuclease P protein subunit [Candidatus Thermoplasmatota archaeon]|nr:ribonuclease P protein subunit [Candidatus Thermoplasmatota archaeon]